MRMATKNRRHPCQIASQRIYPYIMERGQRHRYCIAKENIVLSPYPPFKNSNLLMSLLSYYPPFLCSRPGLWAL